MNDTNVARRPGGAGPPVTGVRRGAAAHRRAAAGCPGRGARSARRLVYPPRCLLVVAGVPGAGKTTLLRRLYALTGDEREPVRAAGGVLVLDSEQARNRWGSWLRHIPYRYWRPLVHLTHYLRLWHLAGHDGPVVLHECGTRPRLFSAVVWMATRHRRDVHVILLDVPAPVARESARARPRPLHRAGFERHAARWARLLVLLRQQPDQALRGARSVTVLDRAGADELSAVEFCGTPPAVLVLNAPFDPDGAPRRPPPAGRPTLTGAPSRRAGSARTPGRNGKDHR